LIDGSIDDGGRIEMARKAALTARQVETMRTPGLFGDGGGLYLRVAPTGGKFWVYRYMLNGRRRDMGLGSVELFSLAEARKRAMDARRLCADGVDPIEARDTMRSAKAAATAKTLSFQGCSERYIEAHRAGWSNPKHLQQWQNTLADYVYPVFGALPVDTVDVGLVMQVLEPMWAEKAETASRLRGRIESILDWATARGYRQGENPARWRGHLENLLPKRSRVKRIKHHAALPYAELGSFMADLRQHDGVAARALEFTILTAARSGEVIGARWEEINIAARLWIIPATRMKAGKEHRVPLSDAALAVLVAMAAIRSSEYVFPGRVPGQPIGETGLRFQLGRMKRNDLTTHGFRSTFSDWCAEQTNFPSEVREMALAHAVGDKVEAAYRRGDLFEKRRQLAEAWARYCSAPISQAVVVPLRV
jgi:integrase